jgi:regulator of sirC expression with transglutaminase-like and TPR domain
VFSPPAGNRGEAVIADILMARKAFAELVVLEETVFPLDRAALTIGLEEYPKLDIGAYLRKLDTLAARTDVLAGNDRSSSNLLECLNEVLFVQEALRGNSDDYYDPRNSYLHEVLDRKQGIPITLSVLYIEVARRIGFQVQGVGFPGHFFVKCPSKEREILIDPFTMGRVLGIEDCQDMLDRIYGGSVHVQPSFFNAMEKRSIATRMLFNLKGIYYQREEFNKALAIIDRILMLNPGTLSEIRDRGLLYMQTSLFSQALADLEYYLQQAKAPEDVSYIEAHIKTLRGVVAATN